MSEFKVGDKVKIRKDSQYYGLHPDYNPADVIGVVTQTGHLYARWPCGHVNSYGRKDLELARAVRPRLQWI